jgi:hypothetical protein
MLRDAWPIAWYEFKQRYLSLAMNMFASVLIALVAVEALMRFERDDLSPDNVLTFLNVADLLLLAALPALGALSFSREYMSWNSLTDEPFLKRLRFYRMWAIPLPVIAWSRMLYMLLCFVVSMTVFVIVFVAVGWTVLSDTRPIAHLLSFALVWTGYAAAICGLHPFLEYGAKAKMIHVVSIGMVVVIIGADLLLNYLLNKPVILQVLDMVNRNPFWPAAISLCAGVIGIIAFQRGLVRRLERIDLP